ncbi:MAG TPA: hypothetical protein DCL54_13710 [Alphaproteobacteria bacterium]|nr:hypothetical protein [Alphaproteobacteria bacterium]HAJ47625.1 hypothetical protein [Alphaproteobacteria bacterium]
MWEDKRGRGRSNMSNVQSWMLWIAGVLAILGAVGVARLPLQILFVQIDMLMPIVAMLCAAAGFSSEQVHGRTTLSTILWANAAAAVITLLPFISLPIVLPIIRIDGLQLIVGFICLLIAYLKTWSRS